MKLIEIIEAGLKRKRMSARQASMLVAGNDGVIKNIKAGHPPSFQNVENLFEVLGINLTYSFDDELPSSSQKVPLLGFIAAGGGEDHDDTTRAYISDENSFDDVSAPPMMMRAGSAFCLEVRGSSMRPAYNNGDRLFFYRDDPLRNQRERLIGQHCAIRLHSNEIYVKRLARPDSGNPDEWNLESLNPVWPVMVNQHIEEALPVRFVECRLISGLPTSSRQSSVVKSPKKSKMP